MPELAGSSCTGTLVVSALYLVIFPGVIAPGVAGVAQPYSQPRVHKSLLLQEIAVCRDIAHGVATDTLHTTTLSYNMEKLTIPRVYADFPVDELDEVRRYDCP